MTNCREIADFLMAYVDGDLPDDQRAVFDAHMAACPCCEKYLTSYRITVALGRQALCDDEHDTSDLPEELVRAVLAARRKHDGPGPGPGPA